jgi:RHS repeat-associated protein
VAQKESDLRCLETHFELKIGPHSIYRGDHIQDRITTLSKQKPFWRRESYQDFLSDKLLAGRLPVSHRRCRQSRLPAPDPSGLCTLKTDQTSTLVAETRYLPYGEERWITGTLVTDFTFTGQRAERGFGLLDYNARYYDPRLGRFISPDSIVHNPSNPNDLNRYSYGRNNPLKYIDPTGHQFLAVGLGEVVLLAGLAYLACEAYEVGYQYGWGANAAENRQALATAVNDVAEQVGTAFTPPSVPSSNPDAFPLGSPPDPYYVPGPALDTPEWSGLPGVPLDQPDTGTRAIDFPLEQPGPGNNLLYSSEEHHIISPKTEKYGFKNHPAVKESGIDIENDPDNLVNLSSHRGRHTNKYHDHILDRLDRLYRKYGGTPEPEIKLREELGALRQDLLSGKLDPYMK